MSDDASTVANSVKGETGEPDPGHVVSLVGANVGRLRARAGLSLRELATRADVSTSTMSNIEAGSGNPGVETLVQIAGALGVPFSELVMPHEPDVHVLRADEGVTVEAAGAPFTSRLLVAERGRSVTEVYECRLDPGRLYRAEPHMAGVVESVFVVAGRMRVGPGDATVELAPGDRATFAADQPHQYESLAPGTQVVLVLSYR